VHVESEAGGGTGSRTSESRPLSSRASAGSNGEHRLVARLAMARPAAANRPARGVATSAALLPAPGRPPGRSPFRWPAAHGAPHRIGDGRRESRDRPAAQRGCLAGLGRQLRHERRTASACKGGRGLEAAGGVGPAELDRLGGSETEQILVGRCGRAGCCPGRRRAACRHRRGRGTTATGMPVSLPFTRSAAAASSSATATSVTFSSFAVHIDPARARRRSR